MDISIVIPTLNEADRIAELIQRTRAIGDVEIIVIDGGSHDHTLHEARKADHVATTKPSRAIQQNRGASIASGEAVLFLHADSWLEPDCLDAIREQLKQEQCVGGCFRQRIEASGTIYRAIEWGNVQRVRWLKWAYGDQGIFVRREVFQRVGGFPEVDIMEDLLFMKRLKRAGRIVVLEPRIHTSARRWKKHGVVRQTLRNWSFVTLTHCGVSPNWLAGFYPPDIEVRKAGCRDQPVA